jgi:hypothetical protein
MLASAADTASGTLKARKSVSGSGFSRTSGSATKRVTERRTGMGSGTRPACASWMAAFSRSARGIRRGILVERLAQHRADRGNRVRPAELGWLVVPHGVHDLEERAAIECGTTRNRLVDHGRRRKHVASLIGRLSAELR